MSPEMLAGNKAFGKESDIWMLGNLLVELLSLQTAFTGTGIIELARNIVEGDYVKIPDMYSAKVKALVAGMLKKNPRERPTIDDILGKDFIQPLIHRFLTDQQLAKEFPHLSIAGGSQQQYQIKKFIKLPTHSLTHTFSGISEMQEGDYKYCESILTIRGVKWRIWIKRKDTSLVMWAVCNRTDVGVWSCRSQYKLMILPMMDSITAKTFVATAEYSNISNSWGNPNMIAWSTLMNPSTGFLNSRDEITCQLEVKQGEFIRQGKREIEYILTSNFNISNLKDGVIVVGDSVMYIHGVAWKILIKKNGEMLGMFATCHEKGDSKWNVIVKLNTDCYLL